MTATILEFRPRTAATPTIEQPEAPRHDPALPYSFDIYQAHQNGMVSIDACVPASVAAAMLNMLQKTA